MRRSDREHVRRQPRAWRWLILAGAVMALAAPVGAAADDSVSGGQAPQDLSRLSIEDLSNIEIYSVAKTVQPLSDAPAAIYVITHDDIIRSGATSLPEMLRLAPNLQVAQITATSFAITARGFNGSAADKLLVLIDGRSVYTPFVNGVFWDAQRMPPEDIERIEVISGPGAALWGANAVNGVINIVTRKAGDTPGVTLEGAAGPLERNLSLQFGASPRPDLAVRVYAMAATHGDDVTTTGADAKDGWSNDQAGFRLDWTPTDDQLTVQGDIYRGLDDELVTSRESIGGANLLTRWTQPLAGGTLQIQAYFDELSRRVPDVASYRLQTYDLDVQHSFAWGRQQIVWGGGVRVEQDKFLVVPQNISNPLTQFFSPEARTLTLGNVFGQDTISLTDAVKLVLSMKLEDDAYVGLTPLPSVRLSWKLRSTDLLWAAISRAARAPSRLDRDFFETSGPILVLKGGDFQSEELIAYEVGYRTEPSPRLSASISGFYNDYTKLRSFDLSSSGGLPLTIGNEMVGQTYGVETWANYQVADWWRLTGGANWLHESLRFKPGSITLGGIQSAGNDPAFQLSLRSSMNLPHRVTLDAFLRNIGALPAPASPTYVELDGRLAWAITRSLQVSVTGANLLHDHHPEFGSSTAAVQLGAAGVETGRSVLVGFRWTP